MRRLALILLFAVGAGAQQTHTVNIVASANPWEFTPGIFTVTVGERVTLNISEPANDASPDGHGFLMTEFVENGITIPKGQTRQVSFTVTSAGEFAFVCTVASCGLGHGNMFGKMVAIAADPQPSIASIAPNAGPAAGGTAVTIRGSGFVAPVIVRFGGTDARNVVVVASDTITAITPAHAKGTVDVTVATSIAAATKAQAFTYADARRRAVRH